MTKTYYFDIIQFMNRHDRITGYRAEPSILDRILDHPRAIVVGIAAAGVAIVGLTHLEESHQARLDEIQACVDEELGPGVHQVTDHPETRRVLKPEEHYELIDACQKEVVAANS